MKTVARRIGKLEDTFRPVNGEPLLLLVVTRGGKKLAFAAIPNGLDAEELDRFLREHGAETRGLNGVQNPGGNAGAENQEAPIGASSTAAAP